MSFNNWETKMTQFVATAKQKSKRVAIAIVEYPEGAMTCVARAEAFLSDKMDVPRSQLSVTTMERMKSQKNFVLPTNIPIYQDQA